MQASICLPTAPTDNMAASAAGSGLRPQRDAVAEAVAGAEAARLRLHRRYLEEQGAALEAAGGHSDGDFACQAWLHAMLRSVDEVRGGWFADCKSVGMLTCSD